MATHNTNEIHKMKIALCISGQPRSFEKGYEYHYKNIIENNDVDVVHGLLLESATRAA